MSDLTELSGWVRFDLPPSTTETNFISVTFPACSGTLNELELFDETGKLYLVLYSPKAKLNRCMYWHPKTAGYRSCLRGKIDGVRDTFHVALRTHVILVTVT